MNPIHGIVAGAALLRLLAGGSAHAADEALPGAVLVIKPATLVKVVARTSATLPTVLVDEGDRFRAKQ